MSRLALRTPTLAHAHLTPPPRRRSPLSQLANYTLTSAQAVHAVRLVRLMKLARLVRTAKVFRHGEASSLPHVGLRDLTALLGRTGKYLLYTFLLSWLLIYIFAIVGMRVFGGELYIDDQMNKQNALNDRLVVGSYLRPGIVIVRPNGKGRPER